MLKFNQFLTEKLFDHYAREGESELVHHTSGASFNEFHPMSHFGTSKAARDRAVFHPTDSKTVYVARLKLGKIFHDEDVGDHDPSNYLSHLRRTGFLKNDEYQKHKRKMDEIQYRHDDKETNPNHEQNSYLASVIRGKGYHTIAYKNEFEHHGSTSYIITHPDQVRLIHKKENASINDKRLTGQV